MEHGGKKKHTKYNHRSDLLAGSLSAGTTGGIGVVVEDTCSGAFTFLIKDGEITYRGRGQAEAEISKSLGYYYSFALLTKEQQQYTNRTWANRWDRGCEVTFFVHPSQQYREQSFSRSPTTIMFVAVVFFVLSTALLLYNSYIQKKQQKIIAKASRSEAIVQSLFPTNVRERILVDSGHNHSTEIITNLGPTTVYNTEEKERMDGGPIADLFPSCTVIFMDLANFTAWSRYGFNRRVVCSRFVCVFC
jgi:hypothetical protein